VTDKRPVTPGEYLPVARELMRHRDEIRASLRARDEEDVAGSDQAAAAARETRREATNAISDLQSLGIDAEQIEPDRDQARFLAWSLAIGGAITRRIPKERQCPHATPGARRPLTALLTSRLLFCPECRAQFASRFTPGGDDERCDVCDREATAFSEFSGTLGSLWVVGNICPRCRFWLDSLQRSSPK
jgi:hypothetical protein